MNFDLKGVGIKSTRDRKFINLPKPPGLFVSPSGVSNTLFSSSDPDEIGDSFVLLLQEKQAGNTSDIIVEEIVAIVDRIIEYKCITKKQQNQLLIKCNLLHTKKN